ncbi:MAG: glycosyltransferase family 2 protein [Actinomyces graevenitzii]|nr:glycosyltransferase family 2 protein [Actinomyces graevenitzii]
MSQQRKSVRVVIVNWRTPLLTERAARSLWPQLRAGDELVVVDNASASADPHDNSLDHLRRLGAKLGSAGPARFGLVQARRNGGFGYGVNLGARNLRQDALVLLNSDAYALEGFVDALTAPLGHDLVEATTARLLLEGRWRLVDDGAEPASPQAPSAVKPASPQSSSPQPPGAVGPNCPGVEAQTEPTAGATHSTGSAQLRGLDGGIWVSDPSGVELINSTGNVVDACGNGYDRSWLASAKQEHDSPEVFGICGGACAISARAWRQLGGMRQDLFMYYEDTDFSYRLRRAGYRVQYVRQAQARHAHAASSDSASEAFTTWNTRNRLRVATRYAPASVAARALVNTGGRMLLGPQRQARAQGLVQALAHAPQDLYARIG